jgi:hypothetical protein
MSEPLRHVLLGMPVVIFIVRFGRDIVPHDHECVATKHSRFSRLTQLDGLFPRTGLSFRQPSPGGGIDID